MFQELLNLYIIFAVATAAPTTTPPATGHYSTAPTQSTSEAIASANTTVTENSPSTGSTTLLRWRHGLSSSVHRLRGRIVLANTRAEGSEDWGLTADEAEAACDRVARYQSELAPHNLLSAIVRRLLPRRQKRQPLPMEGHLLSIGSGQEVLALSHLLSPVPSGAYWTGGKLVRYRVNSMKHNTFKDHIVLTWSDGRVGQPSVLGMTREDEEKLREGYNYCLALNLADAAWQARDCADLLPYACVITPRQVGFSNEAEGKLTTSLTSTATTPSTETTNTNEATTKPPTGANTITTTLPQETAYTTGTRGASNSGIVTSLTPSKYETLAAQNLTSTAALLAAIQTNSDMISTTPSGGATESSGTLSGSGLLQEGLIAPSITVTPEANAATTVATTSTKSEGQILRLKRVAGISLESGGTTISSEPTEPTLKGASGLQKVVVATGTGSTQAILTSPVTVVGSPETSESTSVPSVDESAAMEPEEQEENSEGI